ncbi:MAG: DUF2520 domain-containing protein [Bacteroidetes bacterium]|nr:DUF2520 domain-containing protein [Bacteroidota bacterium]
MRIGLVGAGNTAWQLGHHLAKNRVPLAYVTARNSSRLDELAAVLQCPRLAWGQDLPHCQGVLLCVSDDAIGEVSASACVKSDWMAHCSGSQRMDALRGNQSRGVFYPLQTMTWGRPLPAGSISICIEAASPEVETALLGLASACGFQSTVLDSPTRQKIHVAAVVVNNFVNHLLGKAEGLLQREGLPRELLFGLASETLLKYQSMGALQAQTGPARRGDGKIIGNHESMLAHDPELLAIYQSITQSIIKAHSL